MARRTNPRCLRFLLCLLLVSLLLTAAACADGPEPAGQAQEPYIIAPSSDYPMSGDLHIMEDHADCIVLGHFDAFEEAFNMARNPADPTKESSDRYSEGHLYRFRVEQVIKGDCGDAIRVSLPYKERIRGEITNVEVDERGNLLKEATERDPYEFEVVRAFYMEPDPAERVMLFLLHGDEDVYFAAIEPFRIAFDDNDIAALRSNLLLPQAEKEALARQTFRSEGGREVVYEHRALLQDELTDTISGRSLQDILDELHGYDLLSPTATPATLVFRGDSYLVMCAPELFTQDPALEEAGWQIVPGPASDSEMIGPEEALKISALDMEASGGEGTAPESVNMTLVQFTGDGMTDVPAWLIKVSGFDYLFTGSDVDSEVFAKSDLYYLVDAYSGESLGMLARSAK